MTTVHERRLLLDEDDDENAVPEVNNTSTITQLGDPYVLGNHHLPELVELQGTYLLGATG